MSTADVDGLAFRRYKRLTLKPYPRVSPPVPAMSAVPVFKFISGAPRANACRCRPEAKEDRRASSRRAVHCCQCRTDVIAVAAAAGAGPDGGATVKRTSRGSTECSLLPRAGRRSGCHACGDGGDRDDSMRCTRTDRARRFRAVLVCDAGHVENVRAAKQDLVRRRVVRATAGVRTVRGSSTAAESRRSDLIGYRRVDRVAHQRVAAPRQRARTRHQDRLGGIEAGQPSARRWSRR